jgi:hypothetical protein
MPAALSALVANLRAGARLALFLRVARLDFRIDARALVLLVVFSALVDIGVERVLAGPDALLDLAAVGGELASLAILVLVAALLGAAFRDASLALALPVIVLASMPLVQAGVLLPLALDYVPDAPEWIGDVVHVAFLAWYLAVLVRSAYVALEPGRRRAVRALAGAALLAAPMLLPEGIVPDAPWWTVEDDLSMLDGGPASEPVLALQRRLQDEALGDLADHVAGQADLYFVAFAPDGAGSVWRPRVEAARRAIDKRYGEGRSIVYLNDPESFADTPFATVTHLREALEEIAGASDPDEDVAMVYVAGRSNPDGSVAASLPPLGLVPLSGAGLAHLFRESGIRWRIVVLEVCDAAPFLEALADDDTLVISAADAGETPAGCRGRGEPTAFGDAFFGKALANARSITGAFEAAKASLSGRDATPVMRVGPGVAEQLQRLGGERRERAAFRLPARRESATR